MGIDFVEGRFTPEPVEVPEALIARSYEELSPGDTGFVDLRALWVHPSDRTLWLYSPHTLTPLPIVNYLDSARLIKTNEGPVVDVSHLNFDEELEIRFERPDAEDFADWQEFSVPVIGLLTSLDDLALFSGVFAEHYPDSIEVEPLDMSGDRE